MTRAPRRFHCEGSLAGRPADDVLELPDGESHHLSDVLRLGLGARVTVFGDDGAAAEAEVVATVPRVRLRLTTTATRNDPEGPRVGLAVAVLKRRAMDWTIEKATELGVATLQPLLTARCVVPSLTEPPERWARISLAAAKQCGRNTALEIAPPRSPADWTRELTCDLAPGVRVAYAHGGDAPGLAEWLDAGTAKGGGAPVWVAIGPEGGWTPEECRAFDAAGFSAVGLGALTLRAETAALAATTLIRLHDRH